MQTPGPALTPVAAVSGASKIFRGRRAARRLFSLSDPVHALERITLEISSGEIIAIAGANGSGKTTLLRLFAGVLLPSAGVVTLAPGRVIYIPGGERQLQERLTGYENLRFLARLSGDDPELIRAACQRTGLVARVVDEPVWTYTTGMRMRLILARAFIGRAVIILLDEPTRFLDLAGRSGIAAEFRRLRDDTGAAIIAATHDLEWIASSDRVVVLEKGSVAAAGRVEGLDGARRMLERAALSMKASPGEIPVA